jgi:hypothetical protein
LSKEKIKPYHTFQRGKFKIAFFTYSKYEPLIEITKYIGPRFARGAKNFLLEDGNNLIKIWKELKEDQNKILKHYRENISSILEEESEDEIDENVVETEEDLEEEP